MPLMRGRELKHLEFGETVEEIFDAPYAGARIETILRHQKLSVTTDAPYAGARIETCTRTPCSQSSHDAPYAGARIETYMI